MEDINTSEKTIARYDKDSSHATAVDRRGITAGLKQNARHWQMGRKTFKVVELSETQATIRIEENRTDDWSRPYVSQSKVTVFFK